MKQEVSPYVSVIIPVFNDAERLQKCLTNLENQTYSKDAYEVIVIDNASEEHIDTLVGEFPQAIAGYESQQGSYAARNKGLALAKGKVLAFTDSDCLPTPEWLENGVKSLQSEQADLAGGRIAFAFSPQQSDAEIFDSITALQVKNNIETRQLTVTANLFACRHVFDDIGLFDASLQSGGDFKWTKKATNAGYKLVYSPDATIMHPARSLNALIKKGYRVGTGQLTIQRDQNVAMHLFILKSLRNFLPPNPWGYWKFICQTESDEARRRFISMWAIAWLCSIALSLGRFSSMLKKVQNPSKISVIQD